MQISKFVKNLFHCYTFAWRLKAGKITFPRLYAFISVLSYMAFKSLESKNLVNPFHRIIRNLQINSFEVILKLRRLACPCDHAADLRVFQNPCQSQDCYICSQIICHFGKFIHNCKIFIRQQIIDLFVCLMCCTGSFRIWLSFFIFTGQKSLRQR